MFLKNCRIIHPLIKYCRNVDKFVRFVNLMINDVTYLMDESLSELTQIHNIQVEMDDKATWESKPLEYRREREGVLRSLERHASGYTTLGRSTVELLKIFTAETKAPFMMPEIVDRLAAMLDYNLQALVGPKCQDLVVREPEKLKFNPRALLSDIIQVFLNLSDQPQFVQSVAGDGRSYTKELFDRAAAIAIKRGIKSQTEIDVFRAFVDRVEVAKAAIEAEEDLGDVPDEFLGMFFACCHVPILLCFLIQVWVARSVDVYSHERSGSLAFVENDPGPSHYQITFVVRLKRSLQPFPTLHRRCHPRLVLVPSRIEKKNLKKAFVDYLWPRP